MLFNILYRFSPFKDEEFNIEKKFNLQWETQCSISEISIIKNSMLNEIFQYLMKFSNIQ